MLEARICVVLSEAWPVLSVSDSILSLLGYAADDFLTGRIVLQTLIHHHDQDIAETLFDLSSNKPSEEFNIRIRHSDGRIRCIKGCCERKPAADGSGMLLELLLQDVRSLPRTLDDAAAMPNFRAMMDITDDYIYFKDRNHVFTGASQTLVQLCKPAEHWSDLLGQTDYDVFPEEYADSYYRLEKQVFSGQAVAQEVQEYLTNDGRKGWVDNRKYPIHSDDGRIIGLYGIARDVTGRIETELALKESEERFRAISDASFGGVVIHDKGRIIECNDGLSEMTGFSYQELIGMDGLGLIAPESLDTVLHHIQHGYTERYEVVGLRKDGSRFPLSIKGKNVTYKGMPVRVIEFLDLTEQKFTEKTLEFLAKQGSAGPGSSFFDNLAEFLAEHLGMEFICIDRLEGDGLNATTLSVWHDGTFEDNVTYALKDTPCGEVLGKRVCCFPSAVVSLFPHDEVLKELQADSYVGVTLWSLDGRPIGLIAVIGRSSLKNRELAETTLQLVALRAAAELERLEAEEALKESEARFRSVVENIPNIAVQAYRLDGTVVFWNRASELLYGYSQAEALGGNLLELIIPPEMRTDVAAAIRRVAENRQPVPAGELLLQRKDGSRVPVFSSHALICAPHRPPELFCLDIDLSEMKQAEQALEQARCAAESANRAKSAFLANMSHEIRTPMNGIIGMAQLLQFTTLSDEQQDYLKTMTASANSLLSLLNDILDLSKIEAERLEITPDTFSLRTCISEIISTQRPRITEKGLKCTVSVQSDLPDALIGDQLRIRQILLNLLSNAIKFTEQGTISVAVTVVEQRDSTVLVDIAVEDTGIGVPLEQQEQIFEPFSQADSSITRRFGGTGLGLTICRRLAELMGGSIRLESRSVQGSCFCLRLPLPVSLSFSTAEQSGHQVDLGQIDSLNILLAEDNQINISYLRSLLRKLGHQISVVENGRAALEAIKTERYDLVLMDIKMPVMNGDEALSILREREGDGNRHLPVIALTAFALNGDREKYLGLGFDGYLPKPMTARELLDEMKRVLGIGTIAG